MVCESILGTLCYWLGCWIISLCYPVSAESQLLCLCPERDFLSLIKVFECNFGVLGLFCIRIQIAFLTG